MKTLNSTFKMQKTITSFFAILLFLIIGINNVNAGTCTWTGTTSTVWSVATNWSGTGAAPTAADDVVINKGGSITIYIDANTTINSLTITSSSLVTFIASGAVAPRTITIDNIGSSIASGSTLYLRGISGVSMGIAFSGSNNTMNIAGMLYLYNYFAGSIYDATNSLTTVSGSIINSSPGTGTVGVVYSTTANLSFLANSIYIHNCDGGAIPIATWNVSSTCKVQGTKITAPTVSSFNQVFGNFTWSCTTQTTNISLAGNLKTIKGTFTVTSTGTVANTLQLTSGTATTLTVGKNFSMTGGILDFNSGANVSEMDVAGNFSHTVGTITVTGTGSGSIIFNGISDQYYTSGGTVSNTINYTVNNGAILKMAAPTTVISGGGTFTLSSGATLGISSPNGITISALSGNIQVTGTRTYSSGAKYIYNGTATQVTGDGLTQNTPANLTIYNGAGVTLSASTSISGLLTLTTGRLSLGNFNLTLGASSPAVAGTLNAARMVVINGTGEFRKIFTGNGSFLFPVGELTGTAEYSPLTLNFASGWYAPGAYASVKVTNSKHPNNADATDYINRYWTVGQSGITFFSCSVTGSFLSTDIVGATANMITQKWVTPSWEAFGAVVNTITATGVSKFGDFTAKSKKNSLTISTSTLTGFTYTTAGPSTEQLFNVSGIGLTGNVTVTPPADYEISTGTGASFVATNPITITQVGGVVNQNIYVRLKAGLTAGQYNENIVLTSSGATTQNVACTGIISVITVSPATLSGFKYTIGLGPSTDQSFTVSGASLTADISIIPSTYFEISTSSGSSFLSSNPIKLTAVDGTVNPTTIYVRLKSGLPIGTAPASGVENITSSSLGAASKNVACTGTVVDVPIIATSTHALTGFTYSVGSGPSAEKTFIITGTNLLGNITVTPTTNFEISTGSGASFVATNPISLTPNADGDVSTTVYVRLKAGLGANIYEPENVVLSSSGATSKNVACSGNINGPNITISTGALAGFLYKKGSPTWSGGPSPAQSFTVSGTALTAKIVLTAPANYEISKLPGNGYASSLTLAKDGAGVVNSTTIYVRLKKGLGAGTYISGLYDNGVVLPDLAATSTGAITKNIACSGAVVGNTATISTSRAALSGFSYELGHGPSDEQSFVVSGASLAADITITAHADYEISKTSGGGYTSPLTLAKDAAGVVSPTTIYVRLKTGKAVATYGPKNITVASGALNKTVSCSGAVYALPTITAGSNGTIFCPDNSINLTSTSGVTVDAQYWDGPSGFYSTDANPVIASATPSNTGTYTVNGQVLSGVNLITNGDFENGDTDFSSSYGYAGTASDALQPNTLYTIVDIPNSVHSNFSTCGDHTTGSGNQMVINGASLAEVDVWTQLVAVKPYTDYKFVYYIQTVCMPAPAQLQFYVNGAPAGANDVAYDHPFNVDDKVCTNSWKEFHYVWNSGTSTLATLSLINKNTEANGNDYALDDISFQEVFSIYSTVDVTVKPSLPVGVSITVSENPVYKNTSVTFTATPTNGGTSPTYQWCVNGSPIGGATGTTYTTSTLTDKDKITCVMTSNYDCTIGGNTKTSNEVEMTVKKHIRFWIGSAGDNKWSTPSNWQEGIVPETGDDVDFSTFSNNNKDAVSDLVVDGYYTVGSIINETSDKRLVIPPKMGLVINDIISTQDNPNFIYIQSSQSDGNGTLIFKNPSLNPSVLATVEMYTKAYKTTLLTVNAKYKWQYFGIPLTSVTASPTFNGSYVRIWKEAGTTISNHWVQLHDADVLTPFTGYEITQVSPKTIVFQGELVTTDFNSGTLPYTYYGVGDVNNALYPGQMIYSNPYTAAIDINKLKASFGSDMIKSVFLYNTGSFKEWEGSVGATSLGTNPGQYTAVPVNLAGVYGIDGQIPSMQGFLVKATSSSANATFTIPYTTVVMKNADLQRAPKEEDKVCTRIDVKGTRFSDHLWIFTEPTCTRSFDNGWDGEKMRGTSLAPQIYAMESDNDYQVDAVDDINDTYIGFTPGEDTLYNFTFINENTKTRYMGLYLIDLAENKMIDITQSGTEYTFVSDSTNNTLDKRFKIVTTGTGTSEPVNTKLMVFNSNGTIFVNNLTSETGHLELYDIAGHQIQNASFGADGITTISTKLPDGVYVVKAATKTEKISKQLILH